jgi:Domain of unknown function (DUF4166)
MTAKTLFPSVLGADFAALDPCLRWVHSGASRRLRGSVTVERGTGWASRVLGTLASVPSAMKDASIEVHIEHTRRGERWIRFFAGQHRMVSTLHGDSGWLVEQLGPAALKFRLSVHAGRLAWVLERISVFGIALPLRWFRISATIDSSAGRYHFLVDSQLRGVGRIVRYEGLIDAAP